MEDNKPLVSIGMPVYNGECFIREALDSLLAQDYEHFELIISDNASTDGTQEICLEYAARDERIRYYRNEKNMGAVWNFKRVLELASGEYFMWAAHDDMWEEFFVSRLVEVLESSGNTFIAANFEAQYIDDNSTRFEFFAEGEPFYSFQTNSAIHRLKYMLRFNYGNLVYSLFRTNILITLNLVFVENEIPFLLQVTFQGNWKVIPAIGFYKRTNSRVYRQARWEKQGGILRPAIPKRISSLRNVLLYHNRALGSIEDSIDTLGISRSNRFLLKALARWRIWSHFLWLMIGYKRRPF